MYYAFSAAVDAFLGYVAGVEEVGGAEKGGGCNVFGVERLSAVGACR